MSGWWIVLWTVGVLLVLGAAAHYRWHPVRAWWYDWQGTKPGEAGARHLVNECDWCGPGAHCTCLPQVAMQAPEQDFYGSMILADEPALYWPAPIRWKVAHEASGWRAQTAAELSPEALAAWEMAEENMAALLVRHPDSGPGGSSLAPGPDPQTPIGGDAQGRAVRVCADESRPAARADMTGSLSPRHHEEDPGWLAHSQPGPVIELGPNAARVLARWEAQRRERWRLDWDNETVAA